jgi:hypothetical protein
MIDWAVGDVDSLLKMHSIQYSKASAKQRDQARRITEENLEFVRVAETSLVHVVNPRNFIGRGGANIKSLMKVTKTLLNKQDYKSGLWVVYYTNSESLKKVKEKAAMY